LWDVADVLIYSSNLQLAVPSSDQKYLKYFSPLKIIALAEIGEVTQL